MATVGLRRPACRDEWGWGGGVLCLCLACGMKIKGFEMNSLERGECRGRGGIGVAACGHVCRLRMARSVLPHLEMVRERRMNQCTVARFFSVSIHTEKKERHKRGKITNNFLRW